MKLDSLEPGMFYSFEYYHTGSSPDRPAWTPMECIMLPDGLYHRYPDNSENGLTLYKTNEDYYKSKPEKIKNIKLKDMS